MGHRARRSARGDRAAEPGLEGHDAPVRDGVEPEEHDVAERRAEGHQREECEALARARGDQLVEVFEEGASAAAVRPVFERMKLDARRHRFDVLIIWAFDRFGRSFVNNVLDVAAAARAR